MEFRWYPGYRTCWWDYSFAEVPSEHQYSLGNSQALYMVVNLPQYPPWIIAGVYVSPDSAQRGYLWQEISEVLAIGLPSLVAGDFNSLLWPEDKRGGSPFHLTSEIRQFRHWKEANHLHQLIQKGAPFTWCNNRRGAQRTWELLDRSFATMSWMDLFPLAITEVLPRHASDHAPIVVTTETPRMHGPRQFRFENFWLEYSELSQVVRSAWNSGGHASPMGRFQQKLHALQRQLCQWRRRMGHLPTRIHETHGKLEELITMEAAGSRGGDLTDQMKGTSNLLAALQRQQEIYWAQRSRVRWLQEGDRNTRFFHAKASQRRSHNRISIIITGDGTP
ncbi:hypothetical protein QJS10_CPA10g01342 [Acorus calamus]|uniref:Endonuclease/exonuclease/phosphatase domain-containing protein n=1 Tax=Acorus calamus TaxID=4465 RepID=A0AAV9E205_ACOCL|nr:hypothetical protein QJS10_CPA10g01342 [Acorus calamus]